MVYAPREATDARCTASEAEFYRPRLADIMSNIEPAELIDMHFTSRPALMLGQLY
ncbi:hypothetical protein [Streptomyces boninensis]|uniref:hypothetical protein n=1 Tax=Streptomyces boninensis TaxID=2039455 RepID=UPI003B218854